MTVFRRRQPRTKTQHARELVWPSAGWRRAGKYFWYRIVRMPGTPYSIAAGLACGVAVSFTPFLGCHFIMAAIFAWIIRANLLASEDRGASTYVCVNEDEEVKGEVEEVWFEAMEEEKDEEKEYDTDEENE